MKVLEIKNLSKNYGQIKALDNLNLTINAGEVYGILGPNGSGKTTTLGLILGVLKADSGSFEWFEGKYGSNARKHIGAILETPNFYPYKTAEDNLSLIAKIRQVEKPDINQLLKKVNLYERRKSKFRTYSLGMKQRLAIAATLIGDPDVIIFDEPTNGLDPQGIAEVREILQRVADSGKSVIMASHILYEVEKICSHVAIIKKGKLLATGQVGSILSNDQIVEVNAADQNALMGFLRSYPWIKTITPKSKFIECTIDESHDGAELNELAFKHNITLNHLVHKLKDLESEFLQITK